MSKEWKEFRNGDIVLTNYLFDEKESNRIGKIVQYDSDFDQYLVDFGHEKCWECAGTLKLVADIACECGNSRNPIGQGHSFWCKRYLKEF